MNIENKVVVVTGAAQGLGFAMAKKLSDIGAKIAIIDLDQGTATEAASRLENAIGYGADIADEDQVNAVFEKISHDFGRIDVLVNNAGILQDGLMVSQREETIKKLPLTQFKSVLDVNLTGTFICGQAAATHMINQHSEGVIVNVSSISRAGNFGQSSYSASKAAVVALTTTWAKELAPFSIRSAAIAPGFIETDMTAKMPSRVLEKITQKIPSKRMGSPDEIALGLKFILENDYFNGRVLEIDGGMRL
ncbi:SDR family oxidoreductase [Arenicella sp. 4NH20-0111]